MVDQDHINIVEQGHIVLQYTMQYCTILVLYVGRRFVLE